MAGSRSARVTNPITKKVKTTAKAKKEVRSFVCDSINGKKPNYSQTFSTNPKNAASKHFSSWCKENNKKGGSKAEVVVRESTRGGLGKVFSYQCTRTKLKEPLNINRAKKDIKINYQNVCLAKK